MTNLFYLYIAGMIAMGFILLILPDARRYSANRTITSIFLWPYALLLTIFRGTHEISHDVSEHTNHGVKPKEKTK